MKRGLRALGLLLLAQLAAVGCGRANPPSQTQPTAASSTTTAPASSTTTAPASSTTTAPASNAAAPALPQPAAA